MKKQQDIMEMRREKNMIGCTPEIGFISRLEARSNVPYAATFTVWGL